MATVVGGSFKRITPSDISTKSSVLNQLVDVIQEDVSGSSTRRAYQIFVTGGIGPGVTSSLFQTVYDQDFSLQTANPILDMTVGLYVSSSTVQNAKTGDDNSGKILFPSSSLMMREKIDIYRQYAATLTGSANSALYAPFNSTTATDRINEALFVSFKRLFVRDGMKRQTFAMRVYQSASSATGASEATSEWSAGQQWKSNLNTTSVSGSVIITDVNSNVDQNSKFGGAVGNLVNAADTSRSVGLIWYDQGTVVLDIARVFSGTQKMSGTIDAMSVSNTINGVVFAAGKTCFGYGTTAGQLIPDLMVAASIDDLVDHFASTRFQSGTLTTATYQNRTNIQSTLIFCRATADEFNFSSNPTFTDSNGRIQVIDEGQDDQRTFTMPTTIGLHDEAGNLLAAAKVSRPIEKNDEKDITFRVRLDF